MWRDQLQDPSWGLFGDVVRGTLQPIWEHGPSQVVESDDKRLNGTMRMLPGTVWEPRSPRWTWTPVRAAVGARSVPYDGTDAPHYGTHRPSSSDSLQEHVGHSTCPLMTSRTTS